MASITDFISAFKGGTRKNRFIVTGTWPSNVINNTTTYHIVSASLPSSDLGVVSVPHRGRFANFAGDRTYEPWDITVLDDTNTSLWHSFHQWQKLINEHVSNQRSSTLTDSFSDAKRNWTVKHLDQNGNELKVMTLVGCWPVIVNPIDFTMTQNGYNTFGVQINYDYFTG